VVKSFQLTISSDCWHEDSLDKSPNKKGGQMKQLLKVLVIIVMVLIAAAQTHAASIFINEIHYDNSGADINEGIEIAGPAGSDLTGWSLVLYNGANGLSYNTTILSGVIPDQQNGFGTIFFPYSANGIQNGAPDGIALVDSINTILQFLSYEGFFSAGDGPASGLTSIDIGVSESGSTPIGFSLQLTGTGNVYEDFVWSIPIAGTYGAVNTGQIFSSAVPEPATLILFSSGLAGFIFARRKTKNRQ
jgi:hypothetical protein